MQPRAGQISDAHLGPQYWWRLARSLATGRTPQSLFEYGGDEAHPKQKIIITTLCPKLALQQTDLKRVLLLLIFLKVHDLQAPP